MSQSDLASKLGKSRSSVCEYESGAHDPSLKVLSKIAKVCGVTVDDLLAPSSRKKPKSAPASDELNTDTTTPSA